MIELVKRKLPSFGGKLYAWIAHVNHEKDGDWLGLFENFSEIVERDTGFDKLNLTTKASHTTIAKIFDSVDSYLGGDQPIGVGVSACSETDQFSRKEGRTRAIKRALNSMDMYMGRDGFVYPQRNVQEEIDAVSVEDPEEEKIYECV